MAAYAVETVEVASFADADTAKCPHCGGRLARAMSLDRGRLCDACNRRSHIRCGQWEEHQAKWCHVDGDSVIFRRALIISGEDLWIARTSAEFATEEEALDFVEHAIAPRPCEEDAVVAIEAMLDAKERADMAFEDYLERVDADADAKRAAAAVYEAARNAHNAAYDALVRMVTGGRKEP